MEGTQDSHGTMKVENTEKRDVLKATERKYQQLWQDEKVFESDAPSCAQYPWGSIKPSDLRHRVPKFYGTMAYPYVNGIPHVGHAFTVSKMDFASRVARAEGKRTLYPQGFHSTGMPIKACSDKLVQEIAMFGKDFEGCTEADMTDETSSLTSTQTHPTKDVASAKFTNLKKGKAALKTSKMKYQFQIMLSQGIPREEIHKFADARHWLHFFPQRWKKHLTDMGCAIDWRRSFVTTDANGYYDSFVRWQMRKLKGLGKIRFGKRYTVYSPKDGQPCLDHDRASGESIQVQEYIAMKCKVKHWSERAQELVSRQGSIPTDASIFMLPATLRPETMYSQTNLFVSPNIRYGIFQVSDAVYYFMTDRAARNMAFQGIFPKWGTFPKVMEMAGSDVLGSIVYAPLSWKGEVYVIPMDTIKETKGTGVVTSVPSESPDDYAMAMELSKKADFYQVKQSWVCLDILPIIKTQEYGSSAIAPVLVEELKIHSPRDEQRLSQAKEISYKLGFYRGTMIFGKFTGKPVQEAKPLIRQIILDSGDGIVYCEPEGLVISRSGDECVAAYLDQWFLTYGNADETWKDDTIGHVRAEDGEGFNSFSSSTKHSLEHTLGWMAEWCVSRQYGLGTELPWDSSQLVEGLSDSTIYMAYYTIAHYLHSDIFGREPGIGNISVSQMTDGVWDYVFALADHVESDISEDTLEAMKREFTYWYPLDMRVSGKDLINNHLIFFLYIHQAVWGKEAPGYLPRGIRLNGHVMINGEKMSKSTGNFLTLTSAIQKFGADAIRVALADGGDGVDDANFEESTANAIVLKLFEQRKWIQEVITDVRQLQEHEEYSHVRAEERIKNADRIQRTGPMGFWDTLFENDMNALIHDTVAAFKRTNYKAALKSGFHDFTSIRDSYRVSVNSASIGMHYDCVRRYVESQALMVCVIAPHWAEYVWREVLNKPTTIQAAMFPPAVEPNRSLRAISEYIKTTSARVNAADAAQHKRLAKGKDTMFDPNKTKRLTIFVATTWPAWQARCIDIVREVFDGITLDVKSVAKKMDKTDTKKAMPFVQHVKRRLESTTLHESVFERHLEFDEAEVLGEMVAGLKTTMPKLKDVQIVVVDGEGKGRDRDGTLVELPQTAVTPEPGSPFLQFVNI